MARTILIVDDDPSIRRLVPATLEDVSSYRLTEAGNGQEALARAQHAHPEIVFLDVEMPRIGWVEACRRLRSDPSSSTRSGAG